MKSLFLSIVLMAIAVGSQAQNAKKDAAGNYIAIPRVMKPGKDTGKKYTGLDGKTYQVYMTESGKLYYEKTSKAGKVYRAYIKTEA